MEGNKKFFKPFPHKRPNGLFKKKGFIKKGKWNSSSNEQSTPANSNAPETIYRILCQSKRIGSVIGKGGGIVKSLRDETHSKITVAESVPGSEERVIIIYSNSKKVARKNGEDDNNNEKDLNEEENGVMEPHCAAQYALMKVHQRIIEDLGGTTGVNGNDIVINARLLVPNNMVGCLLGKKGDVIQRVRHETGATIRVLPADHLPSCAMSTDELVQISGKPDVVQKALYEVSTLLHKNPRKDQPTPGFPVPFKDPSFHPTGPPPPNMIPQGDPMWSHQNPNSHGIPPQWTNGYRNEPPGIRTSGFVGVPPLPHGGEPTSEFFMKILCSPLKIGGVIGKGGSKVRQLQQETGASVHAEDVTAESDERVIRVSAVEDPWNPRSQTIDAILQLQNLTSELSDKGVITTRLLVQSSKVGCIIGQGGHLINEMRRRTRADIRVFTKDEKPKFAAADEELVQISGSFGVAKETLGEIASRLRERCLRDSKGGPELGPVGPVPGFGPPPSGRTPPFGPIRAGTAGGYENFKGVGRENERLGYPVPSATGYSNFNRDNETPNHALGPAMGTVRSHTGDFGGTRVMLQDSHAGGGSECVVEIHGGSSQHLSSAYQAYMASGAPTSNPQHEPYHQSYNPPPTSTQPGVYSNINATETAPYQSVNPPQDPYYNYHAHQQPPPPYGSAPHGSYPNNY